MSKKNIRVLQLIDTLTPGGAERMAVNISNALVEEVEGSYLCCTRKEGMLKEELKPEVGYWFAGKKHSLDLKALMNLRSLIKKERINLVHAHGTSWFWGVLLKLSCSGINLVWHDHYGESENLEERDIRFLKPLSKNFDGIISVNKSLGTWAEKTLNPNHLIQLNNFVVRKDTGSGTGIKLKGPDSSFKIICVANFRPQKDLHNLIASVEKLTEEGLEISLHLVGEHPGREYAEGVLESIKSSGAAIFYYGSQPEISQLLAQAHLGVLSSRSEGLPLVLLEYAMAGLPVVCTDVGECREVTGDKAFLAPPGNPEALAAGIKEYYLNQDKRKADALGLKERIANTYSPDAVLTELLVFYAKLRRN